MLKLPYSTSHLTLAVGNFAEVNLTDQQAEHHARVYLLKLPEANVIFYSVLWPHSMTRVQCVGRV